MITRPDVTAALARGVSRLLLNHGYAPLVELGLGNGRRADIVGLSSRAELIIVETKSSWEDFNTDQKWPDYIEYCDLFYFGVAEDFPIERLPDDIGLIIADGFDGAIVRPALRTPLAPARRRAMLIEYARVAATRLNML
jgi:hypothetical protein